MSGGDFSVVQWVQLRLYTQYPEVILGMSVGSVVIMCYPGRGYFLEGRVVITCHPVQGRTCAIAVSRRVWMKVGITKITPGHCLQ